jgi:hypothetical protein
VTGDNNEGFGFDDRCPGPCGRYHRAAEKQHKAEKHECLKNHMKWDQEATKCVKGTGEKGKEETPHA